MSSNTNAGTRTNSGGGGNGGGGNGGGGNGGGGNGGGGNGGGGNGNGNGGGGNGNGNGNGGGGGYRGGNGSRMGVRYTVRVPVTPEYIGAVVGKGGNTVTKIKTETGARVSLLDPRPGQGHLVHCFSITGNNRNSVDHAERWILRIISNTYRQDHPDEFQDEETSGGNDDTRTD